MHPTLLYLLAIPHTFFTSGGNCVSILQPFRQYCMTTIGRRGVNQLRHTA